ncbi:hypothetical protein PLANPX_5554 [Lacipirellula parvula]|uniref:Uncharacterized protein n=1 Tax=Lacipirellula parvula TaxID=2650471 RepID=A0A5K7XIM0_9BACT|nr:hypothetical protein PLANPX_5554 [Lacipirellula parvula]
MPGKRLAPRIFGKINPIGPKKSEYRCRCCHLPRGVPRMSDRGKRGLQSA